MSYGMGSIFSPDKDQALWNCARECALRRMKKKCRYRFGDQKCNDCSLDIRQYGNFSPQDARLYMMQAQGSARELHSIGKGLNVVYAIVIICVLGIAGCVVKDRLYIRSIWGTALEQPKDIPPSPLILEALQQVSIALRNGVDVDKDGLTNCVDAALTFYKVYPEKNNVKIIINQHPDGRMNHLFNAVNIDGRWHFIEPQSAYKKQRKYWMGNVWGDVYDKKYNRDATDEYRWYIK